MRCPATLKGPRGFTIIEVLMVVAVIGILAAIAIPQFNSYKEKSYCAAIKSDLANIARYQEDYFEQNKTYVAVTLNADRSSNLSNFHWSPGVTLVSSAGDLSSWSAVAGHPNCSSGPFTWDSAAGGMR
ncbi:MAG: prepilin-type N-terminal cleavage/methylation domain-containing protein [Nitrospinae bacterium]|nr:prepilin-type N-terminal cleavage/methylation domain-containing protein [Nitrospinota bacterium]